MEIPREGVPTKPIDTTQPSKLIGSVSVRPAAVKPGQSALVEVLDPAGKPYAADSAVAVTINGVPAARRYVQFLGAGTYTFQVRATSGTNSDAATATLTVAGAPLTFRRTLAPLVAQIPKLRLAQTLANHYVAQFTLGVSVPTPPRPPKTPQTVQKPPVKNNGEVVGGKPPTETVTPQATSYKWTFGDGTTVTTQAPAVTHDYFPAIQAGTVSHTFDVTCTVVHDNVEVTRTLVLNSAYELCKRFGTIVPNVESDVFATWRKNAGFSLSMTVYNVESEPITLTAMGFVPLSDNLDAELPAPVFTTMKTPITIKAKSASAIGVVISIPQLAAATKLGSAVPGFMIYYRGSYSEQGKTTPVLFSRTIRIPLNDSGGAWLTEASTAPKLSIPWDLVKSTAVAVATDPKQKIASDASAVVTDDATQTFAVALDSAPHSVAAKSQARAAIQSGITAAIAGTGA